MMNRGSTLKNFAILALFFSPLICCGPPHISSDGCGIATLENDHRLKIYIPYNDYEYCSVRLDFPEPTAMTLTIDYFEVSVLNFVRFSKWLIIYFLFMFQSEIHKDWLRVLADARSAGIGYGSDTHGIITGTVGKISKEYFGRFLTVDWKTDHSRTYHDMIAYIDF